MGENKKDKHKFWDFRCENCNKKFLLSKLEEEGYIDNTKFGKVVFCPSCQGQTLVKNS